MLEKYWETRRELETLRQRISTEHEDELERLESAKKSLEKRVHLSLNLPLFTMTFHLGPLLHSLEPLQSV